MTAIIVLCIAAVGIAVLYFVLSAGAKLPPGGKWILGARQAHRGLHTAEFPENTLPAFQNAAEHGYGMELDVHLSRDGKVVVYHDDTLERLTGNSGRVEDYTAAELAAMPIAGTAYGLPLLSDVLETVGGRTPVLIEIKSVTTAGPLEEAVYAVVKDYRGDFAIQSFSSYSIGWFKKHAPHILRGQLSSDFKNEAPDTPAYKKFIVEHLLANVLCRPHFISYDKTRVNRMVVQRLRQNGTPALAWTVKSAEEEKALAPYADGIIFEGYEPERENSQCIIHNA